MVYSIFVNDIVPICFFGRDPNPLRDIRPNNIWYDILDIVVVIIDVVERGGERGRIESMRLSILYTF